MSSNPPDPNAHSNFFFGWDLLYKTIEKSLNKKSDILLALIHFMLVRHAKFRCVGVGDDKTLSDDDIGSELLPYGWNEDDNKYALRYTFNRQLYLLLAHRTGKSIIVNLLDAEAKKVSNVVLDPEELVKRTSGGIYELMPTASQLTNRLLKELVEPVFAGNSREITTQTVLVNHIAPRRADMLLLHNNLQPRTPPPGVDPTRPFGWPEVGRGDLDPLGRGGPGNLLQPPSAPDFQNEGRPPRFDPFGTPEPAVNPPPNPDHLRPPSFHGNDYYM